MTFELGPNNVPDLMAGAGMLALAALLVWVAPHDRLHRAFALVQVLAGAQSLMYAGYVGHVADDLATAAVYYKVSIHYSMAAMFAMGYFALRLVDPEGRSRWSRPIAWTLLTAAVVLALAFALSTSLYYTRTDTRLAWGPLAAIVELDNLLLAFLVLLMVAHAGRAASGAHRAGLLFAALGFSLVPSYWAGCWPLRNAFWAQVTPAEGPVIVLWIIEYGRTLAILPVIAALGLVAFGPLRADAATRGIRRGFVGGIVIATASGVLSGLLFLVDPLTRVPFAVDGVWRFAMPLLFVYALLRRQLFGKEVRLRLAISRSTIAAVFIAVFFAASEAAQQFFGESLGSAYFGIAAAGALVFALAPLQRAAERLAEKAVPDVSSMPSRSRSRERAYRLALLAAVDGGPLTAKEEMHLADLAEELGIGAGEALRLRRDVEQEVARR